jgi:hypothetical protein
MEAASRASIFLTALLLGACASTDFVSTWKAPDAAPLQLRGAKVAAVVMAQSETMRRQGEDVLAEEITRRGAIGVPMYSLLRGASLSDEAAAREAAEKAGIAGIVVMKPISYDKDVEENSVSTLEPAYSGYWGGGYYAYGWSTPYTPVPLGTEINVTTTITIDTRVYSMRQNKLVWSGKSKTTDPKDVGEEIRRLAAATAAELQKEGLIQK